MGGRFSGITTAMQTKTALEQKDIENQTNLLKILLGAGMVPEGGMQGWRKQSLAEKYGIGGANSIQVTDIGSGIQMIADGLRGSTQGTSEGTGMAGATGEQPVSSEPPTAERELRPSEVKIAPEGQAKIDVWKSKQGAKIQQAKEVATQEAKDVLQSEQDYRNARGKVRNAFGIFLDTVNRTYEISGKTIPPGPWQAPFTKVLGVAKMNEFVEAMQGNVPEYAAAVARMAIPGLRGGYLVMEFSKGAPSEWSSIQSGINNTTQTALNNLVTYLSRNPDALGVDFRTDPEGWFRAAEKAKGEFEELFRMGLWQEVYSVQPDFVPPKMRNKFVDMQAMEEEDTMLRSLWE